MSGLTLDRFDEFFQALHRKNGEFGPPPYSWQRRLAQRALEADWPGAIDLPTGSGKTACIDIAVFALACQAARPVSKRTAPRRVFFCVNRRVIVDEAYDRSVRIARALQRAEGRGGILAETAMALRGLAGTSAKSDIPPLDVLELRGGIYRDNRWARSATQSTIICTTIDQLGSRLLFRGYGVSSSAAPIQAGLIAYDSLILLDEAHISNPFRQTLENVQRYLDPTNWAEQSVGVRPSIFVPMTATPRDTRGDVIRLDKKDRENESLNRRLIAGKPARLRPVGDIAVAAVEEAEGFTKEAPCSVGIIVNRVATARAIYNQLRDKHRDVAVELVIGSMRPIDRDEQVKRLQALVGSGRPDISEKTSYIVATQCLEVGADYDFDALVTECASLDALRQRCGRLNRAGRPIPANAVILIHHKDVKPDAKLDDDEPLDPIYGNALTRTWNWLWAHAQLGAASRAAEEAVPSGRRRRGTAAMSQERWIDFGIDTFNVLLMQHGTDGHIPEALLAPSASLNAPVILPAYVDFWCQTEPQPVPDPDVSLFLHGWQRGAPDVQVCWRADLTVGDEKNWCDVVALLPPTAAECMSVPISRVRRWLSQKDISAADRGDALEAREENKEEEGEENSSKRVGVLWRGPKKSELTNELTKSSDIGPGDTLVLPEDMQGWNDLGHIPESCKKDVAEIAFAKARDKAALRLHPALKKRFTDSPVLVQLLDRLRDDNDRPGPTELRRLLQEARQAMGQEEPSKALGYLANHRLGMRIDWYPGNRGVVLATRRRLGSQTWFMPMDDGDDEHSRIEQQLPVTLVNHTRHVVGTVEAALTLLPVEEFVDVFHLAAHLHDLGKADERFQAMLRRTDRTDAWLLAATDFALLAKSDGLPQTPAARRAARRRAGFRHDGFRHEMLSVQLAERATQLVDHPNRELALHLIAAHHGYARPFAPVVLDDDPPDVEVDGIQLRAEERRLNPPHRLDSGIPERFWSLTRRFGWWGLAYLEAILRLADQEASASEDAGKYEENDHVKTTAEAIA